MKTCPKCNDTQTDDKMFCYKDGAKLQPSPTCPKCHRVINPKYDHFCAYCGERLAPEPEQSQPEAKPVQPPKPVAKPVAEGKW